MRVRRHCNPLNFNRPVERPDWNEVLPGTGPLEVEIGFGYGTFLFGRARQEPQTRFVGLEVRPKMVERARSQREEEGLENLYLINCNANQSLAKLFAPASIDRFHIHFPDPWFKRRHHKRRIVQPSLVTQLATLLVPTGEVFLMTDVADLQVEMMRCFEHAESFCNVAGPHHLLPDNPFGVQSEWEQWHLEHGHPVYRMLYRRRN